MRIWVFIWFWAGRKDTLVPPASPPRRRVEVAVAQTASIAAAGSRPAPSPATAATPQGRTYRPGLDGLRALAIVGVLLYHAGVDWVPGGLLGVDLFFVISGFLITSLLVAELQRSGRIALGGFYHRRARRLLPALGVVLAATTLTLLLFWPGEVPRFRGDLVASFGYVTNWWFILRHQSYFVATGRPSPFQHLWSLAIEEQFYLLWPLGLLLAWRRFKPRRRLVGIAALAGAGALCSAGLMAILAIRDNLPYGADSSRVYYGTDTHAAGLLLGVAAAALVAIGAGPLWRRLPTRRVAAWLDAAGVLAVAAVVWAMLRTTEFSPGLFRFGFLAFSLAAAVAVVAVSRPGGRLERAFGGRTLRWIGTRSYGLYLWHWPVFVFTRPQLDVPLTGAADLALRLALVAGLAEASYRLVEQPIRTAGLRAWLGGLVVRASGLEDAVRTARATSRSRKARTRRRRGSMRPGQLVMAAWILTAAVFLVGFGHYRSGERLRTQSTVAAERPAAGPARAAAKPTTPTSAAPSAKPAARPTPASTPAAAGPPTPAQRIETVIGDSVMLGAQNSLRQALPRAQVNAVEGRQASAAFALLDAWEAEDHIGDEVVLHVGTNGTIDPTAMDAALAKLGSRRIVLLTDHVPRPWQDLNNRIIVAAAHTHPGVHLVDWNAAASAHPEWLWPDGIHLRPGGTTAYRDLILAALG